MVNNNKVLTVSYGTFSCTLEGFDDSFDTMKAIAEYFRDLAADDRYFGAEPAQPDADMLARIAQREISRQVEARTGSEGIVLRAAEPAPAIQTDQEDTASAVAAESEPEQPGIAPVGEPAPELAAEDMHAEATPAADPSPAPEMHEHAEVPAQEVAQDVQEVAQDIEDPAVEADDIDQEQVDVTVTETVKTRIIETSIVETVEVETAAAEPAETGAIDMAPAFLSQEDVTENDAEDDAPVATFDPAPVTEPHSAPQGEPASESIAAKLQRIRAVVAQNDQQDDADEYAEDEDTDGFVQTPPATILGIVGTDTATDTAPEETRAEDGGNDTTPQMVADHISRAMQPSEPADQAPAEDMSDDPADSAVADPATDEVAADESVLFDNLDADEDESGEEVINILSDEETTGQDTDAAAQARIVKVKRSDLEAAIAAGELEEVSDDQDDVAEMAESAAEDHTGDLTEDVAQEETTPEPIQVEDVVYVTPKEAMIEVDSTLSSSDEADLLRELAEVEAELATDPEPDFTDTDTDADNIFDADPEASEPRSVHAPSAQAEEADVSRLMAEAAEKLDDPESSTSRDTYSHLRAAVAATEADRSAGGKSDDDQDGVYRADLADVVRPRRPAAGENRPARPSADARPAPLKLVAEQRVDQGSGPASRGAVRPRRVTTVPLDQATQTAGSDASDADDFSNYVDQVGAVELADLLEAAASYLSFVEGRDKFSRPQLMSKVRQIKQEDFNREDGLRSFGQLLREGKIEKTGGGRFTVSADIGFRPDPDSRPGALEAG